MGRKPTVKDKRARRYIRITDEDSWKLIDEIAEEGKYKNSFNQIINDALYYGLPLLHKSLFGETELSENESAEQRNGTEKISNGEYNAVIVRLLKEIVLNATINKSILSSIYNAKELEYSHSAVPGEKFAQGLLSDTPEYLQGYEMRGLKNLNK